MRYSNGYPDFKPYEIQSVNIEGLKGNHGKGLSGDFGRADMATPQGKANYALNTWHHHENGTTMQEVTKSVHNRFIHRGGVSKTLKGCAG
ncbi:HNH endonuclease [Pseudomonas sp. WAC2]|uniref:HNH endonuclease n=1 Tax=Pseudomonas sp. WAC2 TaxID=3055057 RepID=UPI0025AFD452|nr:HNH endonuclease [Pseudomonas sp. WAC2]MDN3235769.1 HNH endonuclease [Pseudomonas sp. WAC2]